MEQRMCLLGRSVLSYEKGPPFVPNSRGSAQSLAYFHFPAIIKSNKQLSAVKKRLFIAKVPKTPLRMLFTPLKRCGIWCGLYLCADNCFYFIFGCRIKLRWLHRAVISPCLAAEGCVVVVWWMVGDQQFTGNSQTYHKQFTVLLTTICWN